MPSNKKAIEKKRKKRALRAANLKRIKHSRKKGRPGGLQKALDRYEDRIAAIHAGWDHI